MFEMISAGLNIFGSLMQGSQASQQAKAEARAAQQAAMANAAVMQENAMYARQQAGIAADQGESALQDVMVAGAVAHGKLQANIGSSGISASEGSALEIMAQSAGNIALDAARVKYRTQLSVNDLNRRASNFDRDAALAIQGGNAAYARGMERADDLMMAGFMRAGTAAFGLAGKYGWGSSTSDDSAYRARLNKAAADFGGNW